MTPRNRPEDEERVLIFVDVLGFAELTKQYKVRVRDFGPDEHGFTGSSTTEMANRINRFNNVLEQCAFNETLSGGIQAMLFSDCAFLVLGPPLLTALCASNTRVSSPKRAIVSTSSRTLRKSGVPL